MTSERPRFPIGLTLAAAIVIAACYALGVWQLQRAAWKAGELKRIEALKNAPPQPIGPVLAKSARGQDVTFTRVAVACLPDRAAPAHPRMTTDNGEWIMRAYSLCRLPGAPYDAVWVDRGLVAASRGVTTPPTVTLPAPTNVVGVLSHTKGDCSRADGCDYWFGDLLNPAPYILVAERENPAPPGVTPAPYPDAAGNLEYVGSYAPTWFGLAGVALSFYAAMLWRRYHPKR
jgi:surfeit locus 1 family protein